MPTHSQTTARPAGALYLVASGGFLAVFGWLAARFGYPDVLDRPAAEVLPALLGLGATGRAVWAVYAVLPLLLVPAALAAEAALGHLAPRRLRAATTLQVIAAVAMLLGLARWPSVQWRLAEAWPAADAATRVLLAAAFDAANTYLGNWIGEFVGEVSLYGAFVLLGSGLRRVRPGAGVPPWGTWVGWLGLVAGVIGEVAAFRNVTPLVAPAAEAANVLLPGFLIAFGALLLAGGGRRA
ncbi:MAG: DUF4386 family protein [Gemmatimonadaceae bacterium]|jgi:hypothetical protein|nr:DUF4386 family protein [Gemmatimonadaceae bacterium]